MEIPNSKQQQLTFEKGITNVPSDAVCSDNALQECVGLIYDNGEHRVIQRPLSCRPSGYQGTLLFVHKPAGDTANDIVLHEGNIQFNGETICSAGSTSNVTVTAIGKTLVINIDSAVQYALWKGQEYKFLGDRLPQVEMMFRMTDAISKLDDSELPEGQQQLSDLTWLQTTTSVTDGYVVDTHEEQADGKDYYWVSLLSNQQQNLNDAVVGIMTSHLNDLKKARRFVFPFWVRYAIRLYDGSYSAISNPVLMFPSVHHNCNAYFCSYQGGVFPEGDYKHPADHIDDGDWFINYDPSSAALQYQILNNIGPEWDDIVKGIDIFVSPEVKSFDQNGNWTIIPPYNHSGKNRADYVLYESAAASGYQTVMEPTPTTYHDRPLSPGGPTKDERMGFTNYIIPTHWSEKEFINRLLDSTVFYKLFEIDNPQASTGWITAKEEIDTYTLPNLTTQTQLSNDDYYSRTAMKAGIMKAYNSRLHLADISRGFFPGFQQFSNAQRSSLTAEYDIYVFITTDDGERIVHRKTAYTSEDYSVWFFYPDPRAYRVEFFNGTTRMAVKLKQHPSLNGAYAFSHLPHVGVVSTDTAEPPTENSADEHLPNRVFVSEVNNPFLFNANGDVTVGNGRILGLASQTAALSQEEHGIHPLTVFTDDGIYALRLNSEGVYISSDIFSREVCCNPKSITETDGSVFFASAKGLMVVVGSQVKCVSGQLRGLSDSPFSTFLANAFIAYDYRDSLLWLFNGTSDVCWVYSITEGTFAQFNFNGEMITNVVNSYPDYLLQSSQNIYSLLNRDDINADPATDYTASIITRPMKLENAFALKKLIQIMHVSQMEGSLSLRIFASNNLRQWVELHSLLGMPWKYYKFQYTFSNLRATDRFAGSVVVTREERTNRLR